MMSLYTVHAIKRPFTCSGMLEKYFKTTRLAFDRIISLHLKTKIKSAKSHALVKSQFLVSDKANNIADSI